MISWENSTAFYLIFLAIFIAAYLLVQYKKYKNELKKLMKHNIFISLSTYKQSKNKIKVIFQILAMLSLIFAYAGPQLSYKYKKHKQKVTEIVFLIDVSTSMLAEDLGISRLVFVKKEVTKFLDKLNGQRVALIAFAKDTKVISPLTTDINSLKLYLKALSTKSVPRQGTKIAHALQISQSVFSDSKNTDKAIILISDGEIHKSKLNKQIKIINKKHLWIFTLGVGSLQAVPITLRDKSGQKIDYKRDAYGQLVLTQFNPKSLKKLSQLANGKYYHLGLSNAVMDKLLKDLNSLKNKSNKLSYYKIYDPLFFYFLILAFIFLLLDIFFNSFFLKNQRKDV